MLDIINKIFNKKAVGLDIADSTIEVVELVRTGRKIKVLGIARTKISSGVIEQGRIKDEAKLAKAIEKVLRQAKPRPIKANKVIFGLPENQTYLHVFSLKNKSMSGENISEEEIDSLVVAEAEQHIPLKKNEMVLNYRVIAKDREETDVILAATKKEVILEWQNFFAGIGMEAKIFDIEILANYRNLQLRPLPGGICVVDSGSKTTTISIFDKRGLCYSSTINIAGDTFTEEVAAVLKIPLAEAEEMKLKYGLTSTDKQIFSIVIKLLEPILDEVKISLKYFKEKYNEEVGEIIFIGGSSRLKGLWEYFQTNLNIPVSLGKSRIFDNALPLEYIEVVGLALRGIDKKWSLQDPGFGPLADNQEAEILTTGSDAPQQSADIENIEESTFLGTDENNPAKSLRKKIIILGVILIFGLLAIIPAWWYRYYSKEQREEEIKKQVEQTQETPASAGEKLIAPAEVEEKNQVENQEQIENQAAANQEIPPEITPVAEEFASGTPLVIIKKTETGWLNIRQGPGLNYEIIAKILPGGKYIFLEKDGDWIKIKLADGKEGWAVSKYIEILSE